MLVYGDAVRRETVADKLERTRRYLSQAHRPSPWIVAHGLLVAALIEAGELAQGIADHAFAARGGLDGPSRESEAALELTLALARAVDRSWRGAAPDPTEAEAALAQLASLPPELELAIKLPEGFAFYALYPESYMAAARPLAGRNLRVVGIRSIGTTLGAAVAAAADAPCPVTVRPVGHPFGRTLAFAEGALPVFDRQTELAIVDEGPGLSGSSILAVADAATDLGVGPERIHVFPSHGNGPGPEASEAARAFWRGANVHTRSFDDLALGTGTAAHRLEAWVSDLTGQPLSQLREITGGGWRARWPDPAAWPPAHPWQERRKFLLESISGTWLLRFAGLGRIGLDAFERATRLHAAGFVPQPFGFRHGFIVERWHADAQSLDLFGGERDAYLAKLADYLSFRVRSFPAGAGRGASAATLFDMLRANAGEELGENALEAAGAWASRLPAFEARTFRVATDNRLHAWEWLLLPGGKLLKADALDHHAGHDLVGCQDIAWDIAGARVEWRMSEGEQAQLAASVERKAGVDVNGEHVRFLTACYATFQLGYYRLAATASNDGTERARLDRQAGRYSEVLRELLAV